MAILGGTIRWLEYELRATQTHDDNRGEVVLGRSEAAPVNRASLSTFVEHLGQAKNAREIGLTLGGTAQTTEFRGGLGLRRDIEVRDHVAHFSRLADRQQHAPYGVRGVESGAPGATYLADGRVGASGGPDAVRITQKSTHGLDPGATVNIRTPGYGSPGDRDPAAVARDVSLGKLSPERAREEYGRAWEDEAGASHTQEPGESTTESTGGVGDDE